MATSKRMAHAVHTVPQRLPSAIHRPVALQSTYRGPINGPAPIGKPRRGRGR